MAGSDGNRGYLVQTLIALLDSLRSDAWDRITVEPSHESEKVDILWEAGELHRATQVKSSINSIGKRDAQRWAQELEANVSAAELVLVLVGSCSTEVARIGAIGKVSVPCPKNLDWPGLFAEAAHLLDKFLFSIGLTCESPDQRELLVKGLVTELSCLSSQSQSWNRSDFIATLTKWIQSISPIATRSLHDSVLSRSPRSARPALASNLVGREQERRWLRETSGDKLIVGQPGIGKTFLLREFVQEGFGLFLRSGDEQKIERAIRTTSPSAIVVEDAHLHLHTIEFLRRFRSESATTFDIIADCWPGSRDQVVEKLGIRSSSCLELKRVSDQHIVEIVNDCGVRPSNSFLHMVVWQSAGFPGRATMFVETCLGGTDQDFDDFWNGETLARWVRSRFTDLIGKDAVLILACFAIGGGAGVSTKRVAKALGLPFGRVSQTVANLAAGGIVVELYSGRIVVVPKSIRAVLVRDQFFGSGAIPRSTFLKVRETFSETVKTIVEAYALGAEISSNELWKLVKRSDELETWQAFVHSSQQHANSVIAKEPGLILLLANDLLHVSPNRTIPELLQLADGDERPLHSHPEHPLRRISTWAKSGFPERDAVKRRRAVLDAFHTATKVSDRIDLALRLLPIALSPQYENMEQDPGDRIRYALLNGCVSVNDLRQIANFWDEILKVLIRKKFQDWNPILDAVRKWLWPHFGNGARITDEQREVIDSSATLILHSLAELARDRPGVLRNLSTVADFHEVELVYEASPSFEALFPKEPSYNDDSRRYESALSILAKKARALGESWLDREPSDVVGEISHWIAEAAFIDHPWPDLCAVCCDAISSRVDHQLPWIRAIVRLNAQADLLTPFLRRAMDAMEEGCTECLSDCLNNDNYRSVTIQFALTHRHTPDHIVDIAIANASNGSKAIRHTAMLNELPDQVISKLLSSSNRQVVCATLEGLWHKLKKAPTDKPWYDTWRHATVRHLEDDYCLRSSLKSDSVLRQDWLAYLCSTTSDKRYFDHSDFDAAVDGLTDEERIGFVDRIEPTACNARRLVIALVGESDNLYKHLIKSPQLAMFWATPLQRKPDSIWSEFACVAIQNGVGVDEIVDAARTVLSGFAEVPKKYHEEIETWESLLETVDSSIRHVVEHGLGEARNELRDWERREREHELR